MNPLSDEDAMLWMHADVHRARNLDPVFAVDCRWCTDQDARYQLANTVVAARTPDPTLVRVTWRTLRSENEHDCLLREQYSRDVNIDAAPRGVEIPVMTKYGTIESITVGRVPR